MAEIIGKQTLLGLSHTFETGKAAVMGAAATAVARKVAETAGRQLRTHKWREGRQEGERRKNVVRAAVSSRRSRPGTKM